jgi:hypothetical protein
MVSLAFKVQIAAFWFDSKFAWQVRDDPGACGLLRSAQLIFRLRDGLLVDNEERTQPDLGAQQWTRHPIRAEDSQGEYFALPCITL